MSRDIPITCNLLPFHLLDETNPEANAEAGSGMNPEANAEAGLDEFSSASYSGAGASDAGSASQAQPCPFEELNRISKSFGADACADAQNAHLKQLSAWQDAFKRIFLCCVDRPLDATEKAILMDVRHGLGEILFR